MLYNTERPHTFDAVVGQKDIVENIRKQSIKNRFFQVYILGGQFGSGKTTMARIIAMAANCEHKDANGNPCCQCEACKEILDGVSMDVTEIDAASNTGVDNIRALKESVEFYPTSLKKKVYIIDEVHMLSSGAFNALLKVLEEPPAHAMFVLCTTEVKKIPATVRSRAAMYTFGQIREQDMFAHLQDVAKKHDITFSDDGLHLICKNSDGAMRNALALLEQVSLAGDVTEQSVADMIGITDTKYLFELAQLLIDMDQAGAVEKVNTLLEGGKDPAMMVTDLLQICADAVLAVHDAVHLINGTKTYCDQVSALAGKADARSINALASGLMEIRAELRSMPGKVTLICGIIRMLSDGDNAVALLTAKVEKLQHLVNQLYQEGLEHTTTFAKDTNNDTAADDVAHEDEQKKVPDTDLQQEVSSQEHLAEDDSHELQEGAEEDGDQLDEADETEPEIKASTADKINEDACEDDFFGVFSSFDCILSDTEDNEDSVAEADSDDCCEKNDPAADTSEENDVRNTQMEENDIDKVHEYIADLCANEPKAPFLKSVLTVPCKEVIENGSVVFVTSQKPILDILEKYEDALGPFPFSYRMENAM